MERLILTSEFDSLSKGDIKALAIKFVNNIMEGGEVNPLEMYIKMKRLEMMVADVLAQLKSPAIGEASKHGKAFNLLSAKCQLSNGRITYNYDEDNVFCDLKTRLKERELILKKSASMKEIVIDEDGVIVPKVSINYGEDQLSITL
jgi:hypothetical protein